MKVWILSKLFVDPSLLKLGSKNRYQSPETAPDFYFNTTKMNTKKVWIHRDKNVEQFHCPKLSLKRFSPSIEHGTKSYQPPIITEQFLIYFEKYLFF